MHTGDRRRGRVRATYGWLLEDRSSGGFLAASILARLAFSMLPLSLIVFVGEGTGSIAAAGFAAGAWGLASALHPLRGRVVDRHGPRALAAFVVAFVLGLLVLVVVGESTNAPVPVVAAAALAGLVVPPVGPFARAVLGAAFRDRPERLRAAFAADSVLDEATLVGGPVLVGGVLLVGPPTAAILVAAGLMLVTGIATALSPLARRLTAAGRAPSCGQPGATARLAARDLRLALAALAGAGVALGALEVSLPAFATARGATAAAGLLAGALSAGGVVAGILYGAHGGRGSLHRRFALWTGLFAVALLPVLAIESVWLLGLALVLAGLALGPLWIVLFTLVDAATPPGHGTRIFGWVVAVNNAGVAGGAAGGGLLVGAYGTRAGFLLAVGGAAAGAAVAAAVLAVASEPAGATPARQM